MSTADAALLHARKFGWNRAFLIKDGVPTIANLPMKAKVVQEPWMKILHYNSPTIFDGRIGVYDYRWGVTAGYRVVDGQREDVRQVVIRDNHVVSNEPTLTHGEEVRGLVLIGRGTGANALNALRVGEQGAGHLAASATTQRSRSRATRCCCSTAYAAWSTTSRCTPAPRSASTATPARC